METVTSVTWFGSLVSSSIVCSISDVLLQPAMRDSKTAEEMIKTANLINLPI
jgi:hypothetical protein